MKSRQVGFVLMALILIGVLGIAIRLISSGQDDFVMEGLMPITQDVITRIEVTRGEQTAELVKTGEDNWRVGKYPAFAPRLGDFWTHIADIPDSQLVARLPKHHELLGVDEVSGTHVTFYLDQSVQEAFLIGKWSPEVKLCYVRKSGKEDVYGIPCARNDVFSSDPDTWRNPIVAAIPEADIASFDFIYPDSTKSFSLVENEDGDWTVQSPSGLVLGPADSQVIDVLLQAISIVPAVGFEEEGVAKGLDFDAPEGAVRINTLKDSSSPTTRLKFIRKDTETFYVKIPSQSTVFFVDGRPAEFLLMRKEDIQIPD
ncbi:MAG: DUF4340 domain-containing protein [Chloroflexota bacterium]|nr:DUF4340 domain-containing protein [Chloroflexota bacterium]